MMRGGPLYHELRAIMEALFNRLSVCIAGQGYAVMIGFV
jgi:hypothetical protein